MSSSVSFRFEVLDQGVPAEDWEAFCEAQHLVLNPGNGLYWLNPEVSAERDGRLYVSFSTYYMSESMTEVVRLAMLFWHRFGGSMSAAPELVALIAGAHLKDAT
jgi:hypothetical protein